MAHIEIGKITYSDREECKGQQGYFIQFKGKQPGLLHLGSKQNMWISVGLAKDLGLIDDENFIPMTIQKQILGKKIEIIIE